MPRVNLPDFLFESPTNVWKKRQRNLSQEQINLLSVEQYLEALSGPFNAYLKKDQKDLTRLGFKQLEILYRSISKLKEFKIRAEKGGKWLTNQILLNPSLSYQDIVLDYIPALRIFNQNIKNPSIQQIDINDISNIDELKKIISPFLPTRNMGLIKHENYEDLMRSKEEFIKKFEGYPAGRNSQIERQNLAKYAVEHAVESDQTHKEILMYLAKYNPTYHSAEIRKIVAQHSNTPEDILEILVKDEEPYVRVAVAKNYKTPEKSLEFLARDDDEDVRKAVGENENLSHKFLENFADDPSDVQMAIANNKKIAEFPKEVLEKLAESDFESTRLFLAQNPNAPREALIILAKDENKIIQREAIKNAARRNIPLQESKQRRNKLKLLSILF